MEMEEITKEEERPEEGERKKEEAIKKDEIKKEDEGATEVTPEDKTKEEAEPDYYSKLQNPSENIYSEAFYVGAPAKTNAGKETAGNTRWYRVVCVLLAILCLILLVIVITLSLKLQSGTTDCPERVETVEVNRALPPLEPTCSQEKCQALFPRMQPQHLGCRQCADGWLTFGSSCFYLSTYRLNWDESQKNCSARGGALAVVNSWRVQDYLTTKGNMNYWIGLKYHGAEWSWVNNAALTKSYWADFTSEGDCGILSTDKPRAKNWIKASCGAATYFICQLQL
ncbi:early activation antigen CD69 isoform X1 [Epinephelus fuscoguttatus]|uniref:early activation antigen CD69 isoform X1 n=1 Tax=Epinephelus fuscoguttatus TaxID=293821 RepID=UPI0020D0076E|nr:early activation antigen CD69 isoform X1 [Epinephelus fuscoguttatus]